MILDKLFERLRLASAARRGEKEWRDAEYNDIREQMLAYKASMEAEIEAYRAEKEAELAQIADAMDEMDYMEALADSFAGGPGSEGDSEGAAQ